VPKVLYLTTTFPRFSETFLQREISFLLNRQEIELEIRSLWGGPGTFLTYPAHTSIPTTGIRDLPRALCKIPAWIFRSPQPILDTLKILLNRKVPNLTNWLENNWGFAWAMDQANTLAKPENRPDLIHATWGTMPSAAAYALHHFLEIPYSMEAHAYDVYKNGGDWLLSEKAQQARFVRSSTRATQQELLHRYSSMEPHKYHLVRRGISTEPINTPHKPLQKPLRLITVGRIVEKKNISFQLQIYRHLVEAGVPFHADIVGHGPVLPKLRKEADRLNLTKYITFCGRQVYSEVEKAYQNADVLLFTGKAATNGDRDGLPNVIAEAMTHGLPVLTTPFAGAMEAITHEQTGFVLSSDDPAPWVETLASLHHHPNLENIRQNAKNWILENFSISENGKQLLNLLLKAAK
jgi:colanic acid/amylovoran biosynthesis glycosyltransferase